MSLSQTVDPLTSLRVVFPDFQQKLFNIIWYFGFVGCFIYFGLGISGTRFVGVGFSQELLSLEECIKIAINQNPEVVRARLTWSASEVDVRTSRSDLLPQISVSTGYNRSGEENTWYSNTKGIFKSKGSYSTDFFIRQTIFDTDLYARLRGSQQTEEIQEESLREMEATIILKTTEDYYTLLRSKRLLEVRGAAQREREENLRKTERLFQLGSASKADLLKSRVGVSQAKVALVQAERELENAKANLSLTMGYSPKGEQAGMPVLLEIVDDLGIVEKELPPLDQYLTFAEEKRPEISRERARIRVAQSNLFAARGRFLPQVSLSWLYSYNGPDFPKTTDTWDEWDSWRLSLNATWDILPGYSRLTIVQRASRDVATAHEDLRQQELRIALEVQSAYLALKEALALLDLTLETEAEAEESYKASRARYGLGAASILELMDAEVTLTGAQTRRIQSLYDYQIAKARLENAVGSSKWQ